MRTNLPIGLLCGLALIVLGACGGGGGDEDRLRTDLEAAQQELEEQRQAAEEAEAARKRAEEEAAEAERKRKAAEEEAAEAEAAEAEAERLRQEEEEARLAAEEEQRRLEQEAEEALQEAIRAAARPALAGLANSAGTVSDVVPKRGSTTTLTTTPTLTLRRSSISSLGGWSGTALSSDTTTHKDDLAVYSNIGPATSVGIQTKYSSFSAATGRDGFLMETIDVADAALIRSSAFPTAENDPKTFDFNHDSDPDTDGSDGDGNTRNDYDTYRVSGTYDGASGHFECTATCTVERLGNRYVAGGTWTFYTSDSAKVLRDDQSYMYFGWWKREQKSDGVLTFAAYSGGGMGTTYSATNDATNFDLLGGTVTYRGPAAGQYAIYQPAGSDSGAGSFTASAELTANFSTNMLSGRVTNFSSASDWTLTLNEASMAGGNVEASDNGTVTWEIGDVTSQHTGGWLAEFFSEATYGGQTPDGVAGTFNARFDDVGRLIGAFGARK